jgi:hypothetical protein
MSAFGETDLAAPRVPPAIGPDGVAMTLRDLPQADCGRWVTRRKAQVVLAIRGGLLGLEEALERYRLTQDELIAWGLLWDHHGMRGLRTTQLKNYRAHTRSTRTQ